jgi:hypothetical protein
MLFQHRNIHGIDLLGVSRSQYHDMMNLSKSVRMGRYGSGLNRCRQKKTAFNVLHEVRWIQNKGVQPIRDALCGIAPKTLYCGVIFWRLSMLGNNAVSNQITSFGQGILLFIAHGGFTESARISSAVLPEDRTVRAWPELGLGTGCHLQSAFGRARSISTWGRLPSEKCPSWKYLFSFWWRCAGFVFVMTAGGAWRRDPPMWRSRLPESTDGRLSNRQYNYDIWNRTAILLFQLNSQKWFCVLTCYIKLLCCLGRIESCSNTCACPRLTEGILCSATQVPIFFRFICLISLKPLGTMDEERLSGIN